MGSIKRSTKWGLGHHSPDFEIDDQDLVPWSIGDLSGDDEYRARINERFELIKTQAGSSLNKTAENTFYSTDVESREENEHGVFAWHLCRIEDPNGNYGWDMNPISEHYVT